MFTSVAEAWRGVDLNTPYDSSNITEKLLQTFSLHKMKQATLTNNFQLCGVHVHVPLIVNLTSVWKKNNIATIKNH